MIFLMISTTREIKDTLSQIVCRIYYILKSFYTSLQPMCRNFNNLCYWKRRFSESKYLLHSTFRLKKNSFQFSRYVNFQNLCMLLAMTAFRKKLCEKIRVKHLFFAFGHFSRILITMNQKVNEVTCYSDQQGCQRSAGFCYVHYYLFN